MFSPYLRSFCFALLLVFLTGTSLLAQTPYQVRDINPGAAATNPSLAPTFMADLGGKSFFVGHEPLNGYEVWVTDGTASGTGVFIDLNPGRWDSIPQGLTVVDGNLYFRISSTTPRSLVRSDGTPGGTVLLGGVSGTMGPEAITSLDGMIYFGGWDWGVAGTEPFMSDGTPEGTLLIKDIVPGPSGSIVQPQFEAANGLVFFVADDGINGKELWRTDGTEAGTEMVVDLNPGSSGSNPEQLTAFDGLLFFSADEPTGGRELWKTDGTAFNTVRVKDIQPGAPPSSPENLVVSNGSLFFRAADPSAGRELMISDGTSGGTQVVLDIISGLASSNPNQLVDMGGTLYFSAQDGTRESLWRSDGTGLGTQLVKPASPGPLPFDPTEITPCGSKLFFQAVESAATGEELWVSDGSAGGTNQVADLNSGVVGSTPREFGCLGTDVVFSADDGLVGLELWRSDGTGAGTALIKDFRINPNDSDLWNLTDHQGTLIFSVDDGVDGREPWYAAGTPASADLLMDVYPGSLDSWYYYQLLAFHQGLTYFYAYDPLGFRVISTDGTPGGTTIMPTVYDDIYQLLGTGTDLYMVAGIFPSWGDVYKMDAGAFMEMPGDGPENYRSPNGMGRSHLSSAVLFSARDSATSDVQIWHTDGTDPGTIPVKTMIGNSTPSANQITPAGGLTYFTNNKVLGDELWVTDLTSSGTRMVMDINPSGNGYPGSLTAYRDKLVFSARDGVTGREIWTTDATITAPLGDFCSGPCSHVLSDFSELGERLYFLGYDLDDGIELWRTDSTPGGTQRVTSLVPGNNYAYFYPQMIEKYHALFFNYFTPEAGLELWWSDGTASGTALLANIGPGAASSDPLEITASGGQIYMQAGDMVDGQELWAVEVDPDGDGWASIADCANDDDQQWNAPSNVDPLSVSGASKDTLNWSLPSDWGSVNAPVFDVLRSSNAGDWSGATCIGSDQSATSLNDGASPSSGQTLFYLIKGKSSCRDNPGSDSSGAERILPACP